MKARLPAIAKYILIIVAVVGSIAFFGYQLYRNMGKGSKASGNVPVTVSMSSSVTGTVPAGSIFTIGVTLSATQSALSAVDLQFNDPQDALDYVLDPNFTLEDQSIKAFDETIRLATTSRSDGTKKLERITMVAKRATTALKPTAILRLRFRARTTTANSYPSAISFGINSGISTVAGPGILNNAFSITPANPIMQVILGCSGTESCRTGNVCYQSVCRPTCTADTDCGSLYHCEKSACVPGSSGGSSSSASSSAGIAPTVTPGPTGTPDKADLLFKVKLPDLYPGIAVAPQVRVIVLDAGIQKLKTYITLYRQPGTDYFQTNTPVEVDLPENIPAKSYTILIKQQKSIQRSFSATLKRHTRADCINTNCGGSLSNTEFAQLWSGDTDGFMDGTDNASASASFNRINETDWQRLTDQYGSVQLPPEPNADVNLDGKIDILDMGIIGKNYQKAGE